MQLWNVAEWEGVSSYIVGKMNDALHRLTHWTELWIEIFHSKWPNVVRRMNNTHAWIIHHIIHLQSVVNTVTKVNRLIEIFWMKWATDATYLYPEDIEYMKLENSEYFAFLVLNVLFRVRVIIMLCSLCIIEIHNTESVKLNN